MRVFTNYRYNYNYYVAMVATSCLQQFLPDIPFPWISVLVFPQTLFLLGRICSQIYVQLIGKEHILQLTTNKLFNNSYTANGNGSVGILVLECWQACQCGYTTVVVLVPRHLAIAPHTPVRTPAACGMYVCAFMTVHVMCVCVHNYIQSIISIVDTPSIQQTLFSTELTTALQLPQQRTLSKIGKMLGPNNYVHYNYKDAYTSNNRFI